MSLLSESGREKLQAFSDWVNADSFDIPPEIVYPEKPDDHHGHDDHGHDDHGHDAHEEAPVVVEETIEEVVTEDGVEVVVEETVVEEVIEEAAHEEIHEESHDEHAHHGTPSVPQPSRAEVRAEKVAAKNAYEEAKRRERAEKIAAKEAAKAAAPKESKVAHFYRIAAVVSGLLVAAILIATVAFLPLHGSDTKPAFNEVTERYLEQGLTETGATNVVAGIILDYRAFDTLGESLVLFTATIAVFFLLHQFKRVRAANQMDDDDKEHSNGMRSLPSRVVFSFTVPFVLLYGIYVVVNGHLSPGGGFSGGVILGGALILLNLVFGEEHTRRFINVQRCVRIMAAGLCIYIILKTYHVLTGANGMASAIPLGTPGSIFSAGLILPLNICVGLVVSCTVYALYHMFTSWKA